jgi:hypothetical protein
MAESESVTVDEGGLAGAWQESGVYGRRVRQSLSWRSRCHGYAISRGTLVGPDWYGIGSVTEIVIRFESSMNVRPSYVA